MLVDDTWIAPDHEYELHQMDELQRRSISPRLVPRAFPRDRPTGYAPAPARPRHAPQAAEPTNVLGVFGLSIRTRERDLEDEFQRYGDVEKVVIVYDQRVRRFGWTS